MQKGILASFLHIASSEENNFHGQCDASWCQYKQDEINQTNLFKPGKGLPMATIKKVRPIYMDLIAAKELEKCLHGKTQNQNESYNNMIWERIPKSNYVGLKKLKFGVYDAVVNFNDGRQGTLDIMESSGMIPGHYTTLSCYLMNLRQEKLACYKSSEKARKARKLSRLNEKLKPIC